MTVKLEVFQTSNRGLGVRARELIPKCHFITEYTGELISYEEAKKRTEVKRNDSESNFLLVLKEHVLMGNIFRTHIDATHYGNVARFINHSCEPNMVMFPVRHNSPVPKLCLFSSRAIDAGEELTFSYGETTYKNAENRQIGEKSPFSFETVGIKCLCANKNCVGYLPFDGYLYDV